VARDHARIGLGIWSDDDFRSLPGHAQHLYVVLLTHPELSYCGVLDWRPAKLSGLVGDWTADTVRAAAAVLIERLYIVVDETTEEVLVRSFVRHDGLMKQPKMATAMATAHTGVGSVALRGVIVGELQRLHNDDPELKGWGSEKASALLSKASVDPSTYPCGKGSGNPSGNPCSSGNADPSGKGSASPSSLLLAPTPGSGSSLRSDPTAPRAPRSGPTGTRIPDNFTVTDEMRTWAHEQGWADRWVDQVTEQFRDFWRAKAGRDATKTDWVATWRNWLRRDAEKHQVPAASVGAGTPSGRPSWEL